MSAFSDPPYLSCCRGHRRSPRFVVHLVTTFVSYQPSDFRLVRVRLANEHENASPPLLLPRTQQWTTPEPQLLQAMSSAYGIMGNYVDPASLISVGSAQNQLLWPTYSAPPNVGLTSDKVAQLFGVAPGVEAFLKKCAALSAGDCCTTLKLGPRVVEALKGSDFLMISLPELGSEVMSASETLSYMPAVYRPV